MPRILAPIVVLLLALPLSAAAVDLPGAAKGRDTLAPQPKPETDQGAKDPADFPRPAGLVRRSFNERAGAVRNEEVATYHSQEGIDALAVVYRDQLKAAGWKEQMHSDSGKELKRVLIIDWEKPAREAEVRLYVAKDGGADVWMRTFTYKTNPAAATPRAATPAQAAASNAAATSKATGAAPLGPPPTNVSVHSYNPYSHQLNWSCDAGTTCDVLRVQSDGTTQVAAGIQQRNVWDHAYLEPNTVYRVVVHYQDGRQGSLDYTYANPPQPAVVTGLKAVQTGPNKIKLTWNRAQPPVGNSVVAETYQVTSPTYPAAAKRLDVNSLEVSGLPVGNHWVRVAMVYGDSGNMAPAPKDASVNFDVLTDRNTYRITVLGLECVHETADDPLQLDGKRDEVYLGVYRATVPRQDSNGKPTPLGILRSKVMGDTNGFPDRLQAGTASDKGGIQTGDFVPDSTITTPKPGVTGTTDRFPLRVWEGELTDASDFLVVSPILFEWDSKDEATWNRFVDWWSPTALGTNTGVIQLAQTVRRADPERLGAALSLTWQTQAQDKDGTRFTKYYGPNFTEKTNRPLATRDQAMILGSITTVPDLYWVPVGLVVTRTKLEKLLGTQNAVVVPWECSDLEAVSNSELVGSYKLYIQFERLATPGAAPAAASGTPAPAAPRLPAANPALVNPTRTAGLSQQTGAAPAGPPPTNLKVFSNGPVAHQVSWTADKWTSFDVYRIDSTGRTQIATNINVTSVTDHVYLEPHTKYRVDVHHTDGSVGSADYDYATPPVPATPEGFRAVQTGTGAVKLEWVTINYVSGYQIYGPTLPPEGKFMSSGYSTEITGLPLGQQEFRIAVVYSGDGKLYPAPNQARASVTLHRITDRYRVTLLGLECVHETSDDPLQLDGKRDEVFAGAYVAALPDKSPLIPIGTARTLVMGDTNGFPGRLQAGTASDKGGIETGDFVPDATITTPKLGVTGTTDRFPLRLWEGELSDNGGLIIVAPVVFEWDKDDEFPWNAFVDWWSTPRAKTDVPALAHTIYTDGRWDTVLSSTWSRPITAFDSYQVNFGLEYRESGGNRPIGVEDQANVQSGGKVPTPVYVPRGLCFSHARLEAALGTQNAIIIKWHAQDNPHAGGASLDGIYNLYIQVERLAPPKQSAPQKLR